MRKRQSHTCTRNPSPRTELATHYRAPYGPPLPTVVHCTDAVHNFMLGNADTFRLWLPPRLCEQLRFVTSLQCVSGSTFTGKAILSTNLKKRRNIHSLLSTWGDNMDSRKLQLDEQCQHLHKDIRKQGTPRKPCWQVVGRSLTSADIANLTSGPARNIKWQSYSSFHNTNVKNTTVYLSINFL
jgi:hypothetical protein